MQKTILVAGCALILGSTMSASEFATERDKVGTTDTQTITNKQVDPRTHSTASATSWTPDFGTYDQEEQTALAGNITAINAPSGSPVNGQRRILRIKADSSGPYTISGWNAIYVSMTGSALPSTIAASKTIYIDSFTTERPVLGTLSQWQFRQEISNYIIAFAGHGIRRVDGN